MLYSGRCPRQTVFLVGKNQEETTFDVGRTIYISQLGFDATTLTGTSYLRLWVTLSVDHFTSQHAKSPMNTMVIPKTIDVIVSGVIVMDQAEGGRWHTLLQPGEIPTLNYRKGCGTA